VLFNLLLIAGFWLNPPIQPEEDDEMVAEEAVAVLPIEARDLGRGWPLRVRSGHLRCRADPTLTFYHESEYALSPAAVARGYPDVAAIANPGADLEPLRRRAREMCATQPVP